MRTGNNCTGARWTFTQRAAKWPRVPRCLADTGGRHRWKYAPDRSSRECQKCGRVQQEHTR